MRVLSSFPIGGRSLRPHLAFAAALLVGACGGGGAGSSDNTITTPPVTTPPVATSAVTLESQSFSPASIVVSPGATVRFTNSSGVTHNVTFNSGGITGADDFSSGTVSVVMPTATGTYDYHCTIHSGMTGSVTVQ